MNIIIITQDDYFYIPIFFKRFLDRLNRSNYYVERIIILSAFNETRFALAKRIYNFYGSFDFFRQGVKYITLKSMDKLHLYNSSIRRFADLQGVSVKKIDNVNDTSFIREVKAKNLDVILSVAASQIFKEDILKVPKWGCINVHSAKLPKYRGMMPNFWAMYHGDKMAGITVHTMDKELDKGKIILQDEINILPDDTLDSLIKKSKSRGADLVIEALEMINNGSVGLKEFEGKGSYFSFPSREDIKKFKQKGYKLL